LLETFDKEARDQDAKLAQIQREFYNVSRPLLLLLKAFEDNNITQHISPELNRLVVEKVQDSIQYAFHASEKVRIDRRKTLAKAAKWSVGCFDACDKISSSAGLDSDLFGPEFLANLESQANVRKLRSSIQKVIPSQNRPQQYSQGRGRGWRYQG